MSSEAEALENLIREANDEAGALTCLIMQLEEGQGAAQPLIRIYGKRGSLLLEEALRMNATLFEATPDDRERELRLRLDEALRVQLNALKILLQLPAREGHQEEKDGTETGSRDR